MGLVLVNDVPGIVCPQSHFLCSDIYTAARVGCSHRLRMSFICSTSEKRESQSSMLYKHTFQVVKVLTMVNS